MEGKIIGMDDMFETLDSDDGPACQPSHLAKYFRVRAALFDHTVRGALSPPYTSRRWDRQLRDKPETEIRGLR
jgi:hypothetical protein